MSDGMSDGYRSAREYEERQKRIDAFFGMVLARVTGVKTNMKDFRGMFDAFDAHRYNDTLLHGQAQKERGKRWEAFLNWIKEATAKDQDLEDFWVRQSWAEILSLAMRFAGPKLVEQLQEASPYKGYRLALYVPNGTGRYGKNPPSLYGDFPGALAALGARALVRSLEIDDAPRAVVGVRQGVSGAEREILEEERGKLRFLAVKAS